LLLAEVKFVNEVSPQATSGAGAIFKGSVPLPPSNGVGGRIQRAIADDRVDAAAH